MAALPHALPSLMLFAICWSVGGSCDKAGRAVFDSFLRQRVAELVQGKEVLQQLAANTLMPDSAPVYDWCYDHKVRHCMTHLPASLCAPSLCCAYFLADCLTRKRLSCGCTCVLQGQAWVPWLDTIPEFKCDPSKPFSQIVVPTTDTVRYTYVVDALTGAGKHVLCVGETGTGKTLTLMTKLLEGMPPEVQPVFITFSARTSANQTQEIIGEYAVATTQHTHLS